MGSKSGGSPDRVTGVGHNQVQEERESARWRRSHEAVADQQLQNAPIQQSDGRAGDPVAVGGVNRRTRPQRWSLAAGDRSDRPGKLLRPCCFPGTRCRASGPVTAISTTHPTIDRGIWRYIGDNYMYMFVVPVRGKSTHL